MKRLIIDTDVGIDDAQAIMMALAHLDTEVAAITAVNGNVAVDQVGRNIAKVLDVCHVDIPFYVGASSPLVSAHKSAAHVHSVDGLGDADVPESSRQPETEHAVHALLRLANEAPGEYALLALGPLTNIALAIRLDPTFPQKFREFVVMGGSVNARGNISMAAEFNVYADPEAAYITLDAFPMTTLVTWNTTLDHAVSWQWLDEWLRTDTPKGRFMAAISRKLLAFDRQQSYQSRGFPMPDPLAMGCILEPDIIRASESAYVTVELGGTHTRGQTLADWSNHTKRPVNTRIVTHIDMDAYLRLLLAAVE